MKRLECLDGLRGVLAIYVLLGHMAPFAALPEAVQTALSHGGAAVDLFFTLSGLVIAQSLASSGGRAWPFLVSRFTRIFPVFIVAFAFALAVQSLSCGFERMPWIEAASPARNICSSAWPSPWPAEIAAHLTMTHGLFPNAILPDVWVSFLGAAWSLSTEWQFYLLALAARGEPRRLCRLLLVLAGAGLAWRLAGPEAWQFSRSFLPNKAHFFALGVASVPLVRNSRGTAAHYGLILAACSIVCAAEASAGKLLPPLLWTLCLAAQLDARGLRLGGIAAALRSHPAQYLGAISYCIYLVNEPVQKAIRPPLAWIAAGDATVFSVLWLPAAAFLPILLSAWLHSAVETPARRWGRALAWRC